MVFCFLLCYVICVLLWNVTLCLLSYVWMDGWTDGRTDGRTDGWMDGCGTPTPHNPSNVTFLYYLQCCIYICLICLHVCTEWACRQKDTNRKRFDEAVLRAPGGASLEWIFSNMIGGIYECFQKWRIQNLWPHACCISSNHTSQTYPRNIPRIIPPDATRFADTGIVGKTHI